MIKINKNLIFAKILLINYISSRFFMLENEHMLIFEHKNEHKTMDLVIVIFDQ